MSIPSKIELSAGDLFAEAIHESLKIEEPAEIVNAFLETVQALRSVGNEEYASAMMPETLIRIRELDDLRERAYLMRLFIELQCEMSRFDDMLGTLQLLDFDPEQRQSALTIAAETLAQAGRTDEARQLLDEIEDLDDDEFVRKWIGTRLAEEKRFDEAFAEAEQIEPGFDKTCLLRNIAVEQSRAGLNSEADKTVQQSLDTARQLVDEPIRSKAITAAVSGFLLLRRVSEAIEAAQEIHDVQVKAEMLRSLAVFLWQDGNPVGGRSLVDESLGWARTIADTFHRIDVLRRIGTVLHRMGHADEATAVFRETQTAIKSVQNHYSRSKLFADFAAWVAQLERDSAARRIFQFAIESAGNIEEPMLRMGMLARILELQTETAFTEEAGKTLELLEQCREDFDRLATDSLDRTIAVAYGTLGRFPDALDLARRIADPVERSATFRRLACLAAAYDS